MPLYFYLNAGFSERHRLTWIVRTTFSLDPPSPGALLALILLNVVILLILPSVERWADEPRHWKN